MVNFARLRLAVCLLALVTFFSATALAQGKTDTSDGEAPPPAAVDPLHTTVAENTTEAWTMITEAVEDQKTPMLRIQGLAALGTLGTNARAAKMITAAMDDDDLDVRTAAVLAAGQTKNPNLTTPIRAKLDDKEPQVAYTAAMTLAKMGDRSGEDILIDVVNGERRPNATLMSGTMHTMSKDIHSPTEIAKLSAGPVASMLLGPFGFGITAYEYMRKNGGNAARVTAIEELAKKRTEPIHTTLEAALGDKDPGVRAAAAKELREYHDKATADSLLALFSDPKTPVRLTAMASYIYSTGVASPAKTQARRP